MHVQPPASFPTSVCCYRYFCKKIVSHGQAIFCRGAIQDIKSKCQKCEALHFATTMKKKILCLLDNNFSYYKGF